MSASRSAGASSPAPSTDVELDLKAVFAAIWAKRAWIFLPVLVAFVGAFAFVNLATPRYVSEARLVIENRETPLTRSGGERQNQPDQTPLDQEAITSQVQIIYSRDIARAVVRELDLVRVPEFDPLIEGRSPLTFLFALVGIARDVSQMTAEERAVEAYYERLSAYPVERSRVIEIRFQSKDPDLAARVANAVGEQFIATQTRAKLERDRRARQHFERTIDGLRQQVTAAEGRVQEHRARFDLLTGTTNQTLGVQSVSELNTQLTAAQAQRADTQSRANAIREMLRAGRPIEAADVFNSPIIQRLNEQRAQLRAELAQQSTVLLPGHPRMREIAAQITDNEAQTRVQAERVARGLDNDARIAGDRVATLRRALDEQKRVTSAQGDQEVVLRGLEREAKAQRDLLESWLGMYRESSARDSLDARAADARVVSAAVASNSPAWPKKLPTILITVLSTLVVMVLLLFTQELVSGRAFVAAPHAAESRYAVEPQLPGTPGGGPRGGRRIEPRAAYQALAAAFVARLKAEPARPAPRRIAVTGADRRVGATSVAVALGRTLAGEGRRVVLVDLSGGDVASAAGLDQVAGIRDFLDGASDLATLIHRDAISRLHVIAAGDNPQAASLPSNDARLASVLSALDGAYHHVILDLPSIVASDESAVIAAATDLVLMAVRGAGEDDISLAAREALELSGVRRIELVSTDAAEAASSPVHRVTDAMRKPEAVSAPAVLEAPALRPAA